MPTKKKKSQTVSRFTRDQYMLVGLGILVIASLGGAFLYRSHHSSPASATTTVSPSASATASPISSVHLPVTAAGSLVSVDDTWNLYTNQSWQFSVKLPKQAMALDCFKGSSGAYWLAGERPAPLQVFEGTGTIYVASSNYSVLSAGDSQCGSQPTTLASLEDAKSNAVHLLDLGRAPVASDSELSAFIKKQYGTGCHFTKKPSAQNGAFTILLVGDGKPEEVSQCYVDSDHAINYSPARQEVIYWERGQEAVLTGADGSTTYDQHMADSFRFL
ncbi:MAG: hypothetical protein WCO52_04100 [bacterium]